MSSMKGASLVQTRAGTTTTQPESRPKASPTPKNVENNNNKNVDWRNRSKDEGITRALVYPSQRNQVQKNNRPQLTAPSQVSASFTEGPIKEGPAYKSQAPVEENIDIDAVTESILDVPFTMPLRNVAGLAPQIRESLRAQFSRTRKAVTKKVMFEGIPEEGPINVSDLPFESFLIAQEGDGGAPAGSTVAGDPVLTYLMEVSDQQPRELYVAKESQALRSCYPKINGGQEEGILDDGSQIVSMAEKVAIELGLTWDPQVTLGVESANKQVERSLGLARNVPFRFGEIVLYLQVHIIRDPAYRVLIGRPFSVVGATAVKNDADGGQMVVITCPNTGKQATIPTYPRGVTPTDLQRAKENPAFQKASRT